MNASQNPVPDVAPKNYLQRKNLLIGLGVLFLLIGLITLCYWLLIGQFYEKTDDAYVSGNLVQVMPQISGYITSIYADETNYVRKGDMLVKLEKADTEI
jgi:membrane fusion protein (multidrug efflux system)